MNDSKSTLKNDGANLIRGFFMGTADVVPGVSGGTVALVLGIYERLVTAISRFDVTFCRHLRRRRWHQAARHIDLRFLVSLVCGIAVGFLAMTLAMNLLLTNSLTRQFTFAAFFGMIVASGFLVARMVRPKSRANLVLCLGLGIVGAIIAFWVATLRPTHGGTEAPTYPYLFLCGSVAICAMILPGISGAMISLVLGVYVYMTQIPRDLLHGENVSTGLWSLVAFGSGCAISLILFSKLLRWLLTKHGSQTMAILCGLMFGSLPKLWPFQIEVGTHHQYQPVRPEAFDGAVFSVVVVGVAAMLLVLAVDHVVRRRELPTAKSTNFDMVSEAVADPSRSKTQVE